MVNHLEPDCKNCTGIKNCTKYCNIKVGENIINFVNGIDTQDTNIGEFRKDYKGKTSLMVSGFQLEKTGAPIDILTKVDDITMSSEGKLSNFRGNPISKFVRAYADYNKVDKGIQDQVITQLNKFNGKGIVPIPIKPGTEIEINHKGFDGKMYKASSHVKFVKWMLNNKTGSLEATIIAEVGKTEDGGNLAKALISDYGVDWFLPNLERSIKTSEINHEVVRMTNIGLVKPVEFTSGNVTIAIDGNNVYLNYNDVDYIIASWDNTKYNFISELDSSITKSKAYQHLMNNIKFISRHRRFIIPYGMTQPNHIDC